MSRDYRLYVADIVRVCQKIIKFTQLHDSSTFSKDELVFDAVVRNR